MDIRRHPNVPTELAEAVESIAREEGFIVAYDTHFEAGNVELRWWLGKVLNRIDMQPSLDAVIDVTYLKDIYPMFPKLLRWAWRHIPMFPYIAKNEWHELGQLQKNHNKIEYMAQIRRFLARMPPNTRP